MVCGGITHTMRGITVAYGSIHTVDCASGKGGGRGSLYTESLKVQLGERPGSMSSSRTVPSVKGGLRGSLWWLATETPASESPVWGQG